MLILIVGMFCLLIKSSHWFFYRREREKQSTGEALCGTLLLSFSAVKKKVMIVRTFSHNDDNMGCRHRWYNIAGVFLQQSRMVRLPSLP
jgi:hypothetical protein